MCFGSGLAISLTLGHLGCFPGVCGGWGGVGKQVSE